MHSFFLDIRMLFFPGHAEYSYFSADFILKLQLITFPFQKILGSHYGSQYQLQLVQVFSSCWQVLPFRECNNLKTYNCIVSTVFEHTNMAAVSLFWDTNMAAVTSCENTQYLQGLSLALFPTTFLEISVYSRYILEQDIMYSFGVDTVNYTSRVENSPFKHYTHLLNILVRS